MPQVDAKGRAVYHEPDRVRHFSKDLGGVGGHRRHPTAPQKGVEPRPVHRVDAHAHIIGQVLPEGERTDTRSEGHFFLCTANTPHQSVGKLNPSGRSSPNPNEPWVLKFALTECLCGWSCCSGASRLWFPAVESPPQTASHWWPAEAPSPSPCLCRGSMSPANTHQQSGTFWSSFTEMSFSKYVGNRNFCRLSSSHS